MSATLNQIFDQFVRFRMRECAHTVPYTPGMDVFTFTTSGVTSGTTFRFQVKAVSGASSNIVFVDWGDGSDQTAVMASSTQTVSHTWTGGSRTVTVWNSERFMTVDETPALKNYISALDVTKAPNLTTLHLYYPNSAYTASRLTSLDLTHNEKLVNINLLGMSGLTSLSLNCPAVTNMNVRYCNIATLNLSTCASLSTISLGTRNNANPSKVIFHHSGSMAITYYKNSTKSYSTTAAFASAESSNITVQYAN